MNEIAISIEPLKVEGAPGDPEGWCYFPVSVCNRDVGYFSAITPQAISAVGALGLASWLTKQFNADRIIKRLNEEAL